MASVLFSKKYLLGALSVFISIVLVGFLIRYVDVNSFIEIAKKVPLWVIILGLMIYLSINLWRAIRFRILLNNKNIPLKHLFPVVLYYNFLLQTLPFSTGEFSYIILIRQYLNQRLSDGISSLFSSRLFDLLIIIIVGIVGVLSMEIQLLEHPIRLVLLLSICLIILAPLIYFSGTIVQFPINLLEKLLNIKKLNDYEFTQRIKSSIITIPEKLLRIRQPSVFGKVFILSVLTHISNFSFLLLFMWTVGVNVGIGTLLLVIIMVMIASWFRFSFSGFGIMEGGWTMGLVVIAGLDPVKAATMSFFLHGCQVIANVSTGLIGLTWLMKISYKQPNAASTNINT